MPKTIADRSDSVRLQSPPARSEQRRKKHGKTRVANGTDILPGIDNRLIIAKRYREIATTILTEQGGADHCSESRQQLIRRFAAAAVLAEQMESRLANGQQIDIAEHALLCSTLVRVARQIGINRIAKDVTPDLQTYLRQRQIDNDADEILEAAE